MAVKVLTLAKIFLTALGVYSFTTAAVANHNFVRKVKEINANVVFLRHALAPGIGDPLNFVLGNCATQRNLNASGRSQARSIGNYFKNQGITFSKILTSEWCRCVHTVLEMKMGTWSVFSGLNSFFENYSGKYKVLEELYAELDIIQGNELVLMVTHQVVIFEVTNILPASGDLVLYNTRTKEVSFVDLP